MFCLRGGGAQHFTYDTAKKLLTPKADEPPKIPIPTPLVAGALAGFASTLCTYPMELIKTRITIEVSNNTNTAARKVFAMVSLLTTIIPCMDACTHCIV